jgi:hypothetical protein
MASGVTEAGDFDSAFRAPLARQLPVTAHNGSEEVLVGLSLRRALVAGVPSRRFM